MIKLTEQDEKVLEMNKILMSNKDSAYAKIHNDMGKGILEDTLKDRGMKNITRRDWTVLATGISIGVEIIESAQEGQEAGLPIAKMGVKVPLMALWAFAIQNAIDLDAKLQQNGNVSTPEGPSGTETE